MFVNFNVILGFVFGALKTSFRCRYMRIFQTEMNFDYDKILAANILESMRAVNVTKVVDDIATFTWENIPIVSQEGFKNMNNGREQAFEFLITARKNGNDHRI